MMTPEQSRFTIPYTYSNTVKKAIIRNYGLSEMGYYERCKFELCKYAVEHDRKNFGHIYFFKLTQEECKKLEDIAINTKPYDYIYDLYYMTSESREKFIRECHYKNETDYDRFLFTNYHTFTVNEWLMLLEKDSCTLDYVRNIPLGNIFVDEKLDKQIRDKEIEVKKADQTSSERELVIRAKKRPFIPLFPTYPTYYPTDL